MSERTRAVPPIGAQFVVCRTAVSRGPSRHYVAHDTERHSRERVWPTTRTSRSSLAIGTLLPVPGGREIGLGLAGRSRWRAHPRLKLGSSAGAGRCRLLLIYRGFPIEVENGVRTPARTVPVPLRYAA